MAGELTPLVLLPRDTTYAGQDDFYTIGIDVTRFSSAIVNIWRGKLLGTTPTIGFTFQESADGYNWTNCAGVGPGVDPGQDQELQYTATLAKQWFRVKVTLGGTSPIGTCWAVGFLEERLT